MGAPPPPPSPTTSRSSLILFKIANHAPHLIVSSQHISPSSFLCVLFLLLPASLTTWNIRSSRTGFSCDGAHGCIPSSILVPGSVQSTNIYQDPLLCSRHWQSSRTSDVPLRVDTCPRPAVRLLLSIKNGSQKPGETLDLPRAIPKPWHLLGATADHTAHSCCPTVPLMNPTVACAGL